MKTLAIVFSTLLLLSFAEANAGNMGDANCSGNSTNSINKQKTINYVSSVTRTKGKAGRPKFVKGKKKVL